MNGEDPHEEDELIRMTELSFLVLFLLALFFFFWCVKVLKRKIQERCEVLVERFAYLEREEEGDHYVNSPYKKNDLAHCPKFALNLSPRSLIYKRHF